jgi:hypothetical protein
VLSRFIRPAEPSVGAGFGTLPLYDHAKALQVTRMTRFPGCCTYSTRFRCLNCFQTHCFGLQTFGQRSTAMVMSTSTAETTRVTMNRLSALTRQFTSVLFMGSVNRLDMITRIHFQADVLSLKVRQHRKRTAWQIYPFSCECYRPKQLNNGASMQGDLANTLSGKFR